MRPNTPAFLHTLKLLLPLFACGWGPTFVSPILVNPSHVVHLYTANELRSFHLQINPNGRVDRTPSETKYSAVVRQTVNELGHINIVGVKTQLFLCMHSNGELFGSIYSTNGDCFFKVIWLENSYEVYESLQYKLLVSLGSDKGPLGPNRILPAFSQFLPRENEIPLSELNLT